MKAVSQQLLLSRGALLISNINIGLAEHSSEILDLDAPGYRTLLKDLIKLNGWENSFVDFYYHKLTEIEQKNLLYTLDDRNKSYLLQLPIQTDSVYYQLEEGDDRMVDILCQLNASETLFSTFYFTAVPCTLWGNYGLHYPLFWDGVKCF